VTKSNRKRLSNQLPKRRSQQLRSNQPSRRRCQLLKSNLKLKRNRRKRLSKNKRRNNQSLLLRSSLSQSQSSNKFSKRSQPLNSRMKMRVIWAKINVWQRLRRSLVLFSNCT